MNLRSLKRRLGFDGTAVEFPDPVTDPDELFMRDTASQIKGWLFQPAGILTVHLIRDMQPAEADAFVEIGVFEGRYISLMHQAGARAGRRIFGIDTYEWVAEDRVRSNLSAVLGPEHGIELVRANSQDLTPEALRAQVDGRPIRFVSVDGDHNATPVLRDLELVDAVLADDGIVAVDDFMNPLAVGVTEGVCTFFAKGDRSLAPFAYASNKLFLCSPSQHARLSALTKDLVQTAAHLRTLDATREFWTLPEAYYNQLLFGTHCLILSKGLYAGSGA